MATVVCSTGTGVSSYVVHASFSSEHDPYPSGATITTAGKTLANVKNNSTVMVRASETSCSNGYSFPVNVYRSTDGSSWTYVGYLQSGSVSINAGSGTVYLRVGPATEKTTTYTYTLSYNANGGSGAPATQSYTTTDESHGFTVSSAEPTRSGYTFLGWASTDSASEPSYQPGDTATVFSTTTGQARTLYAVWRQNPTYRYQLSYSNGSTVLFTDDYTTTDSTHAFTVTNTVPTKAGFTFQGWAVSSSATVATHHAGDNFSMRSDNPTATLYAVWTKKSVALFYWAGSDLADAAIIAPGKPVSNITAARWNVLQAKIKELADAASVTFTPSNVITGQGITATRFNAARSGLSTIKTKLGASTALPPTQAAGNIVYAALFDPRTAEGLVSLKGALNALIGVYNNG